MTRCLALSIPLFWATPAFSADTPVIAVVGLHQPGVHLDDQRKVSKALASAVERTHRATTIVGLAVGPSIAGRQHEVDVLYSVKVRRGIVFSQMCVFVDYR